MFLYALYDRIAEEYGPTFEAKNDALSKRSIVKMFEKSPELQPTDFKLYKLGKLDREDGFIELTVISPIQEVPMDVLDETN